MHSMAKQSRAKGIIIAYIVTAVRAISQFFLTSVYLRKLGYEDYGFYQYVSSIASYAIILDFGISSVVNKFTIDYRENNDQRGVENSLFLCLMMTIIAVALIGIAGIVVVNNAPSIFGDLSNSQLILARKLLVILIALIVKI